MRLQPLAHLLHPHPALPATTPATAHTATTPASPPTAHAATGAAAAGPIARRPPAAHRAPRPPPRRPHQHPQRTRVPEMRILDVHPDDTQHRATRTPADGRALRLAVRSQGTVHAVVPWSDAWGSAPPPRWLVLATPNETASPVRLQPLAPRLSRQPLPEPARCRSSCASRFGDVIPVPALPAVLRDSGAARRRRTLQPVDQGPAFWLARKFSDVNARYGRIGHRSCDLSCEPSRSRIHSGRRKRRWRTALRPLDGLRRHGPTTACPAALYQGRRWAGPISRPIPPQS